MKQCSAIVETNGEWFVVGCSGEPEVVSVEATLENLEDWSNQIRGGLHEVGHRGEDVVLSLAATSCVVGQVDLTELPSGVNRQTLTYALEESLPFSAEDVTADFVRHDSTALGIAIETDQWRRVIERLEEDGIRVQLICPWSLIALNKCPAEVADDVDVVIQPNGVSIDLFEMKQDRLVGWSHLPQDQSAVERQIKFLEIEANRTLNVVWLSEQSEAESPAFANSVIFQPFCEGVVEILSGQRVPTVQLRQGALAGTDPYRLIRGHLIASLIGLASVMLCLAGLFEWRARAYERVAGDYQAKQAELFQQVLPEQEVPIGIRSRLESELSSLGAKVGAETTTPDRKSALETLVRSLEGFPGDLRYRLDSVRIQGNDISVVGEFLSPRGAVEFAEGLSSQGFEAVSPATAQTEDGFSMTLSTSLIKAEKNGGSGR